MAMSRAMVLRVNELVADAERDGMSSVNAVADFYGVSPARALDYMKSAKERASRAPAAEKPGGQA
jgi:hypothetical protein